MNIQKHKIHKIVLMVSRIRFKIKLFGFGTSEIAALRLAYKEDIMRKGKGFEKSIRINIYKINNYILSEQTYWDYLKQIVASKKVKPIFHLSETKNAGSALFSNVENTEFFGFYALSSTVKIQGLLSLFLIAIYRDCLINHGFLMLHAAGLEKDGAGYLFFAPSGGGKSTLSSLAKGFGVLSDEWIILQRKGRKYWIHSPFYASFTQKAVKRRECFEFNKTIELRRIYFLAKAKRHFVKPVPFIEAVLKGYRQIWYFQCGKISGVALKKKYLQFLVKLFRIYQVRLLGFKKDQGFLPLIQDKGGYRHARRKV